MSKVQELRFLLEGENKPLPGVKGISFDFYKTKFGNEAIFVHDKSGKTIYRQTAIEPGIEHKKAYINNAINILSKVDWDLPEEGVLSPEHTSVVKELIGSVEKKVNKLQGSTYSTLKGFADTRGHSDEEFNSTITNFFNDLKDIGFNIKDEFRPFVGIKGDRKLVVHKPQFSGKSYVVGYGLETPGTFSKLKEVRAGNLKAFQAKLPEVVAYMKKNVELAKEKGLLV